jgi:hypothetical protein
VKRFQTTGEISPAPSGGDRRSGRIEAHRDYLLGLIRGHAEKGKRAAMAAITPEGEGPWASSTTAQSLDVFLRTSHPTTNLILSGTDRGDLIAYILSCVEASCLGLAGSKVSVAHRGGSASRHSISSSGASCGIVPTKLTNALGRRSPLGGRSQRRETDPEPSRPPLAVNDGRGLICAGERSRLFGVIGRII